jgi:hypothetical protein
MAYAKKKRSNCKWGGGAFNALPRRFVASKVLSQLSPHACKLFLDMQAQYTGYNNGDLTMAWSIMQPRNWKSKSTLEKAKRELLDIGLAVETRKGGRHKCSLYALTIYDIDECSGKLDIDATSKPANSWMAHEPVKSLEQLQAECRKSKP